VKYILNKLVVINFFQAFLFVNPISSSLFYSEIKMITGLSSLFCSMYEKLKTLFVCANLRQGMSQFLNQKHGSIVQRLQLQCSQLNRLLHPVILTWILRSCLMASSRPLLDVSICPSRSFMSVSSFFLAAVARALCLRSSSNSVSSSRTCSQCASLFKKTAGLTL